MHYQLVVLADEIGDAITISSLAWQRAPSGSDQGHYYDVEVRMGLCASDQLVSTFADNWITGTETLVYSADTLDLAAGSNEWEPIILDEPYWYNGEDNLLIDIQWASANTSYSFYTWRWETGAIRSVRATNLSSPTGIISTQMSELMISGALVLDQLTFGGIKSLFGGGGR